MTEDTTPENLRKFLENDDPAMVQMGVSMAEGSGVPEELLPTVLCLYMWYDDKTIREKAKALIKEYAPAKIQTKIKKWENTYLTHDWYYNSIRPHLFESINDFDILDDIVNANKKAIEPLIGIYRKGSEIIWILQQITKKNNLDGIGFLAEKGLSLCDCAGCDVWYDPDFWESPSQEQYCETCCEQFDYKFGSGNY